MYCQTCFLHANTQCQQRTHPSELKRGEWRVRSVSGQTNLRLPRHRRNLTHLPTLQRINHTTLPDIRIPDKSNTDLFLVGVELRELAEELDEGAFAEGVVG